MASKFLVVFGCAHSGAKAADIRDLEVYLKLLDKPNYYGVGLGDWFENAIPGRGKGMSFEQSLTPDEQIDEIVRMVRPRKKKFIGACTSNHSRRTWQEVGIDMDHRLWKELGMSHIYRQLEGTVAFAGKRIAFAHGLGHGTNEWGDARKLLAVYPTVDVVLLSHRHEMAYKWHGSFTVDRRGKRVPRWVLFARTGGLMRWANYARQELYTPQKPGFTILEFHEDGNISVDANGNHLTRAERFDRTP